ncbi:SGNH/GDSL hydrolase family protein, partial [Parapedobacter defluvii]|uniref:SGNH/GDSL hydrolase family protein n=1 Tax=Parapedobacter defluvii TaxID=2045106 RepID=UPI00333E950B
FYGNSIETGANSSGVQHVPPFMPNWTELFIYRLRQHFGGKISYSNQAVGGKTAAWGVEEVDSRVSAQHPDLVVIGFGMNDGTFKVAPEEFVGQIKAIMDHVSRDNPTCEFIVITPMLANPTAIQHQVQLAYRNPLLALSKRGVAVADMTYWHQWLLTHKAYQDMTGNNINHPNDYLARWYAQVLIALLIEHTSKI